MPLDREPERRIETGFQRFDDPVGRAADHAQIIRAAVDGLVMRRVRRELLHAGDARQHAVGLDVDDVLGHDLPSSC